MSATPAVNDDPLMKPADAAAYLNIPLGTLGQWRVNGVGPKYIRVVGSIRYRKSALERFLKANLQETTEKV